MLDKQQREICREILAGKRTELSVKELPVVDLALQCALPLFGYSVEWPEWPQALGTCLAMEYGGMSFLLATKHQTDLAPEGVVAPLFSGPMNLKAGEGIASPVGIAWRNPQDPDDSDRSDLALLPLERRPKWGEGVHPIRIDTIDRCAEFEPGRLLAIAGYPRTKLMMDMDYDARKLRRDSIITLGSYEGLTSCAAGCHMMAVDTESAGGAEGLSGSPVVGITFDAQQGVRWGFAGIAVRGGASCIHFVDAIHVLRFVAIFSSRSGPLPLDP